MVLEHLVNVSDVTDVTQTLALVTRYRDPARVQKPPNPRHSPHPRHPRGTWRCLSWRTKSQEPRAKLPPNGRSIRLNASGAQPTGWLLFSARSLSPRCQSSIRAQTRGTGWSSAPRSALLRLVQPKIIFTIAADCLDLSPPPALCLHLVLLRLLLERPSFLRHMSSLHGLYALFHVFRQLILHPKHEFIQRVVFALHDFAGLRFFGISGPFRALMLLLTETRAVLQEVRGRVKIATAVEAVPMARAQVRQQLSKPCFRCLCILAVHLLKTCVTQAR